MKDVLVVEAAEANLSSLREKGEPVVVRSLLASWPIVKAAIGGTDELLSQLAANASGALLTYSAADPSEQGRFHYTRDAQELNFTRHETTLREFLRLLAVEASAPRPRALAAQGLPVHLCVPGFAAVHPMPLVPPSVLPRMWICNRAEVATHNDELENIACVVAGRRRFILFPPEAIGDLYMGPFELTPGGTPISMVHVSEPDHERFPRFSSALAQAQIAELLPGDVLYIPYQWYHHVAALEPVNILVNYWWDAARQDLGSPWDALLHGVVALRELPPDQRRAWKAMFDHYVFELNGPAGDHLPPDIRGVLDSATPARIAELKRHLIHNLCNDGAGKTGPFA